MGDLIGWIAYGFLAFIGLVLIWQAVEDEIRKWRWQRAWKRGEIKPEQRTKATYAVGR